MSTRLKLLVLAGLVWMSGLGPTMATTPPNVILLISDDQTWTDFGFMGHPEIHTPNLDRLVSQGLVFPRGYLTASLCRPSLATMVTGLYPHQSKIVTAFPIGTPLLDHPPRLNNSRTGEYWRKHLEMIHFIDLVPTLPAMLGERGYQSLQTGKWWEGHFGRGGFTHGMTLGTPGWKFTTSVVTNWRGGDRGIAIGREGMKPIFDFIEDAGDRPFFVWYAPAIPHNPHDPPQRLLDKYIGRTESIRVARYWAMCEWFDETCGELLDYLDEHGLADNTLIVFVADNGYIQRPDAGGADYERSKGSVYDGGIRTPIILRWPGRIQPEQVETPVSSVDLVPTILRACGLEPTREMRGVNLLDRAAIEARKAIFGAVYPHSAADFRRPETSVKARWAIEGNWKLIVPGVAYVEDPDRRLELYDLEADPHERHNLARRKPELVQRLQAQLDEWWPAT